MTEAVFAFLLIVGVEPTAYFLTGNHSTIELYRTYRDELPLLLHNLLDCIIQLTTYLLPRELLSDVLRPMYCIATAHQPRTMRTSS